MEAYVEIFLSVIVRASRWLSNMDTFTITGSTWFYVSSDKSAYIVD